LHLSKPIRIFDSHLGTFGSESNFAFKESDKIIH
jgi:hypothetical protein